MGKKGKKGPQQPQQPGAGSSTSQPGAPAQIPGPPPQAVGLPPPARGPPPVSAFQPRSFGGFSSRPPFGSGPQLGQDLGGPPAIPGVQRFPSGPPVTRPPWGSREPHVQPGGPTQAPPIQYGPVQGPPTGKPDQSGGAQTQQQQGQGKNKGKKGRKDDSSARPVEAVTPVSTPPGPALGPSQARGEIISGIESLSVGPPWSKLPQQQAGGGKGKKGKGGAVQAESPVTTQTPASVATPKEAAVAPSAKKITKDLVKRPVEAVTPVSTPPGPALGPSQARGEIISGIESLSVGPPLSKPPQQQARGGKGKKGKGGAVQAESPVTTQTPASVATPKEAAVAPSAKKITKDLVKQGAAEYFPIPKRKQRVIDHKNNYVDRKIRIEVNYLPLSFSDPALKIFHYDVTFKPDRPKGLFRLILEQMKRKHFPDRHPAFDGRKNLYAGRTRLPFRGDVVRDSVKIIDPEDHREREYDVAIQLVNDKLSLSTLKNYMDGKGTSAEQPQDVIQATDIALRGSLFNRFVCVGRSFFSGPANIDLGGGLELWNGFFQSAIIAWKPYLNVDVANKGFPIQQSVIDYLRSLYNWSDQELNRGLEDSHTRELQSYIKGLKVQYAIQGDAVRRTFKVNGLGQNADAYRFECKGQMINVTHYYQRDKRTVIKYPKLPLLHVGPPQKQIMVPLEFCTIIGRQAVMRKLDERQTAVMVRSAAKPTDIRKERIMQNIRTASYATDPTLSEFGISIQTNFTKVDSVVFKAPAIEYSNGNAMPRNGVWKQNMFRNSVQLSRWAVLVKDGRTRPDAVHNTVKLLIQGGRQAGIQIEQPVHILNKSGYSDLSESRILDDLKFLNDKFGPLQIVLVIMAAQPSDLYNRIKRASELQAGVLTQCLKSNTVFKMNPMTAGNILLKINAKITGVNHALAPPQKPPIFREPVMFVGADVTHPAPGDGGSASIAAVAASFDPTGFKYNMLYRLQPPKMEMIQDLEEVMCVQINHFMKMNNGALPRRIMYYRDGVSEGQFNAILAVELRAIRSACSKIAAKIGNEFQPGITFLVVQKRHHTRFFPDKRDGDGGRNNNVLAGTVVDREITHPTELDFYLVSHQSIQGTARPTKYHVLWDDNDFQEDDLEVLTYYLCYMFSRCNRSVSYPAPTYYAHLAAFRARAYWDKQRLDFTKLRQEQERRGTIQPGITNNSPMFFV